MRILVTSQGRTLDSQIDPRFGRAQFFIVVDSSNPESFEVFENPNAQAPGGAGTASAQFALSQGVGAVVSGSFGPNASMVLEQAGIKMYQAPQGITVREAIRMALSGELSLQTQNPIGGPMPGTPPYGGPQYGGGFGGGWGRGGGMGRGRGMGRGGGMGRGRGRGKGGGWGRGGGWGGF